MYVVASHEHCFSRVVLLKGHSMFLMRIKENHVQNIKNEVDLAVGTCATKTKRRLCILINRNSYNLIFQKVDNTPTALKFLFDR